MLILRDFLKISSDSECCGALSHPCRRGFPQGRLVQSTAPLQAPSSPCGSFTYCSVAGAERHQESVQTATADSSLHCLWREEEVSIHSTGPCCKCDSLCPEGQARLSHLRCMVEKMCMIRYFIPSPKPVCLSVFLPFSFKAGSHHETNGMNLTT